MNESPFDYQPIAHSTWAYLSSLLMLTLFFKFNRFWSVRNFDLVLIILLAPGILLIDYGLRLEKVASTEPVADVKLEFPQTAEEAANNRAASNQRAEAVAGRVSQDSPLDADAETETKAEAERGPEGAEIDSAKTEPNPTAVIKQARRDRQLELGQWSQRYGYIWLFSISALIMIRMLLDPVLIRRPVLLPNLSIGALVFLGCSLLTFLIVNIITVGVSEDDMSGARSAVKMLQRETAEQSEMVQLQRHGPGFPLFHLFPVIPTFDTGEQLLKTDADRPQNDARYRAAAKSLAIIGQGALILGLILIGFYHFNNFSIGVGMATIYLMLPYTTLFTGAVLHVLPGALLVWAIVCFRRPWIAGVFIGLATGVSYYPLFLLPLWISFYWENGVKRFVSGVVIALSICIAGLLMTSSDLAHFGTQLRATFGFWLPMMDGLEGIWGLGWSRSYRLPILVAFFLFCISFVFWPIRKNLGTLIAYTCAIMIGVQFWHGFGGGLFMAWYLPAALMIIFRPAMEGRVASVELRNYRKTQTPETPEDLLPTP